MSGLARTALRLAGIAALNADPVIARLCAGRVYDSRIEPFDEQEPVPTIIVLTEDMQGEAWSENNGGAPFDDRVELVLDIAMTAIATVPAEDGGTVELYGPVATAREMEAILDLIEESAVDALSVGDSPASLLLRRAVIRRIDSLKSARFVDAETGVKLAVRQVSLSVALKGDDQGDATEAPTGDFKNLPRPLRLVCEAMPEGSSAAGVCTLLNAALERPEALLFGGIDATYAPAQDLDPDAAPIPPGEAGSGDTFGDKIVIE
ncbi:MAG TPA: hypothetical protein VEC60_09240 [Reyranella sp.]|nr:hypothetical protein [Reyranella sp.]